MRVAVVGVGVMGSAIAGRLLDTGAAVYLYNTNPAKCEALVRRGAQCAASARDAAAEAEFVITSLNSAAIVEQAVFGPSGIAAAAGADKLLVDMSTIDPARTASLAATLRAETGMGWVDAPLSGGAPAAAQGTLTLMVGGSAADVARAKSLLSKLSMHFTHLGSSGAGQTVKLINQILCASNFLAVAEAVRFAEHHGVDATKIPGRAGRRARRFAYPAGIHGQDGAPRLLADRPHRQHAEGSRDGTGRGTRQTDPHARGLVGRRSASHAGRRRTGAGGQRRVRSFVRSFRRSRAVMPVIIMGVSGCGKTTRGNALARELGCPFVEGDTLHTSASLAKTASAYRSTTQTAGRFSSAWRSPAREGRRPESWCPVPHSSAAIATSSECKAPGVTFVLPLLDRDRLLARIEHRQHFMPASLLESQLAALELPGPDERVIIIDGAAALPEQIARRDGGPARPAGGGIIGRRG